MNPAMLLELAETHLALTRPAAHAHPDDLARNRGKFGYRKNLLHNFIHFWLAKERPWPIRAALVMDWITEGAKPGQPYRDRHRLFAIRAFLIYLRTIEPATDLPHNVFRKPPRRVPRLLSDEEFASLVEATARLRACTAFRRTSVATLLGVLASTGLRIGEALRLKEEEVHLDADPPHLTIRDTKFGKSRIVVLHPTTAVHLRQFETQRAAALRNRSERTFFTNRSGESLSYNATRITFLRLLHHAGILRTPGERPVTLHSFRHGFAVRRLTLWHQAGQSVTELLPHLSVYMGHLNPKDTYWYLTATPELLEAASQRFEVHQREGTSR